MSTTKNFPATREFRDQLKEFAWVNRKSMSKTIADVVDEYANGEFAMPLAETREDLITLKYTAPDSYEKALARAREEGVTLTDVIRYRLAQKMNA